MENVAASIADGARVDWDQADTQVSGRELRLVRHLRLIDSLAEVYRTLPSLVEDVPGPSTRPDFPEGPRWGRLISNTCLRAPVTLYELHARRSHFSTSICRYPTMCDPRQRWRRNKPRSELSKKQFSRPLSSPLRCEIIRLI